MSFFSQFLPAVSSALGIVIFLLLMLKWALKKWIQSTIETASKSTIVKLTNSLQRSTQAYELLLAKEFKFYEKASHFVSKIIVNIQDLNHSINSDEKNEVKSLLSLIIKDVQSLKNNTLIYQSFIPANLFQESTDLVSELQGNFDYFSSYLDFMQDPSLTFDASLMEEIESKTLHNCSVLMCDITIRLQFLSEQ